MVSPARRRDAVAYLCRRHRVSERRACRVVGQHRSTQRYRVLHPEQELRLVRRMNELASRHPRYGYRRIWALLRSEGWRVNHKRIARLWRLEGHKVPSRKAHGSSARVLGEALNASWNLPATRPGQIWSYDFVMVRGRGGGPIRILNVVDEFTRVAIGHHVDRTIGAGEVLKVLERLFAAKGKPEMLRSDNGREFVSSTLTTWLREQGVQPMFIEKGRPQQNPYVERFNGTMRDELLNGEEFDTLAEARFVIAAWIDEYNNYRPHRGLAMMSPSQFARQWKVGVK